MGLSESLAKVWRVQPLTALLSRHRLLRLPKVQDNAGQSDFHERRAAHEGRKPCECVARIVMTASKSIPMTR